MTLAAFDPAALGQQLMAQGPIALPMPSPQALGLARALAPTAAKPTMAAAGPGPAAVSPQLIAEQLRAQSLGQQLQANEAGAEHMRGGAAELGARLLAEALLSGQSKKANVDLAQAQVARNQAIAQQLHPGDASFSTLMALDPEGALKTTEKGYEPMDVRQGNTVLNAPGGGTFQAPINFDDGGQFGQYGASVPGGVQSFGSRPMNYGEATSQQQANTAQASQQETAAQNLRSNALQQQQIAVAQQQAAASQAQAAASQQQAGTAAGSLGMQQQTTPSFAIPGGFQLGRLPR